MRNLSALITSASSPSSIPTYAQAISELGLAILSVTAKPSQQTVVSKSSHHSACPEPGQEASATQGRTRHPTQVQHAPSALGGHGLMGLSSQSPSPQVHPLLLCACAHQTANGTMNPVFRTRPRTAKGNFVITRARAKLLHASTFMTHPTPCQAKGGAHSGHMTSRTQSKKRRGPRLLGHT